MIRIRFHGRGGHGVKTASRIAGSAAFLAGYHVQDSPVYGAERRGAAVIASTRISDSPILERGTIERPDLIVVADETLFNDESAGVLAGQDAASVVFVNTADVETLGRTHAISGRIVSYDVTARTLELLGRASALSAGLGAAAVRLTGLVSESQLREALAEEFGELDLPAEVIAKNQQLAAAVFQALEPVEFRRVPVEFEEEEEELIRLVHEDPLRGSPSILDAGNAERRITGSWRVERPVIDRDICTRCGLCLVRCPDGAIALDEEGYPVIDYDHCKGCMICRHECPVLAVREERETAAW